MVLFLILVGLIVYLVWFYMKAKRLPPGPLPFPLLGNFPQIGLAAVKGKSLTEILRDWQKQYGDVFTSWIGPLAIVNICEYHKANEAMVKKGSNFADRGYLYLMYVVREGRGIIASNSQHWLEQRRFALHTLRNFGLGRNLMQDRIMLEVEYRTTLLNKDIDTAGGKIVINPASLFDLTVGNVINRILFSERFTEESEKNFFNLKHHMDHMMDESSIFDFFMDHWNKNIPPFSWKHKKIIEMITKLLDFLRDQVEMRKKKIDDGEIGEEPENYVDAFFQHMKKDEINKENFNEEALIICLMDLWFAGQETTSTTLYWAFSYLSLHPEIIEKTQEELEKVTGRNRSLGLNDKPNTPYLNAVISEVLRLSSIIPLNLWRNTAEDTQVGSHLIEKGTAITAQLSLIMSDPKIFEEPEKFIPERFLNSNLEQYITPFGLGKRACLGESLARAELYLIMGNLIRSFNIKADSTNPASFKAVSEVGNMRRAQPYRLVISKRHQ